MTPAPTGTAGSATPARVAVFGSAGRLGAVLAQAIRDADDLDLVAELGRDTPRSVLAESGVTVALDVTDGPAALTNTRGCIRDGISVVVGASGLAAGDLDEISRSLAAHEGVGVVVAPNFSVGAVLAESLAVRAARHLASVEIVELHHDRKRDAPSGTARRAAQRIAAARDRVGLPPVADATTDDPAGARGAVVDGIHVHAVRLAGLLAHQEILFGGSGETLTIRHDSTSLASFVPGALLALRRVGSLPGLTVGLEVLLGLDDPPVSR